MFLIAQHVSSDTLLIIRSSQTVFAASGLHTSVVAGPCHSWVATMILSYTHIQPLPAIFGNWYTSCASYESGEVVPSQLTMWQLNFAYPARNTTHTISLRHLWKNRYTSNSWGIVDACTVYGIIMHGVSSWRPCIIQEWYVNRKKCKSRGMHSRRE